MQLTAGFIFLFLAVILPGLIFKRFFYQGQFSRQVAFNQNIVGNLVLAIIPGSIIQLACIYLYDTKIESIDVAMIIDYFKKIYDPTYTFKENSSDSIKAFIFNRAIWYLTSVYIISAISGIVLYIIIRAASIDRRLKIFRFKNQWAYIFSCEILKFQKFKRPHLSIDTDDQNNSIIKQSNHLFPYVNVLVRISEGKTTLYNGYLKDYDLSPKSVNEIECLYLFDASRYTKDQNNNLETKAIPGSFLILFGKDIVNINVNYIYSSASQKKSALWWDKFFNYYQYILIILSLFSLLALLIQFPFIKFELYKSLFEDAWYSRIILWATFNSAFDFLFPFEENKDNGNHYQFVGVKKWSQNLLFIPSYWIIYMFVTFGIKGSAQWIIDLIK